MASASAHPTNASRFEACATCLIARVPSQFASPVSRQCSYFALAAAAAAHDLLALALSVQGSSECAASFVAAYTSVLAHASAAKAASPDAPFIETVYAPRVLQSARAALTLPLRASYSGGPAAHAAPAVAHTDASLILAEFCHTVCNVGAHNIYDDIMGGSGDAAAADYHADKAVKLRGTREVAWDGMVSALTALSTPAAPGTVRVVILHRLVMAFTVIAAGDGRFLVLDSHACEAGLMDIAGLVRYIAYDEDNLPGGGTHLIVTWATGVALGGATVLSSGTKPLTLLAPFPPAAAYDSPLPLYLNALTDERATQAAFDAIASGTYPPLHEVSSSPRIFIGAQSSAGILFPFEDSPAARAATLATLRTSRISTIVCCSADSPSSRVFEGDGISYASALLHDGDAAGKATCASTLCALVERALPLVRAAFARGEGVLVHCASGVHRSGSVAIALLMCERQLTGRDGLAEVFRDVVRRRAIVRPSFWPLLESDVFAAIVMRHAVARSVGSSGCGNGTAPFLPLTTDEDDELLLTLYSEWYGAAPTSFHALSASFKSDGAKFEGLWTTLWFAKGERQAPLDRRLAATYSHLFDRLGKQQPPRLPPTPPHFPPAQATMWRIGLLILFDQVSRNAFRGTARAYATDDAALALAQELLPRFETLPIPIRVTLVLAFIHSEDVAHVEVVERLLVALREPLVSLSPYVHASLAAIAVNHRDRMRLFGRVPERNALVGRVSTGREAAYMASVRGGV